MEDIFRNIVIGDLLDIYGDLLTKRQVNLLDLHYNHDLSLAEIADQEQISRQAVHDALKRGENSLRAFEERLHVLTSRRMIQEKLPEMIAEIASWELDDKDRERRENMIFALEKMIEEES